MPSTGNGLILGIDPGLASTGFALLSEPNLVLSCSTVVTRPGRDRTGGGPQRAIPVIAHLTGVVRRAGPDFVVVDVGGVGYMVSVSTSTRQLLPPPGGEIELDIHTHVREDQLALYGFASAAELDMFEMLIQVDGVGPKVGLNILGAASLEVLKRAIVSEDAAPIRRASGV